MLCLSSFELYSRWVPLEKANRVFRLATKWAFFRPLGMIHFFPTWENIFFFIIYYLLTMVDVRVKTAWYWTRAFQLFSAYGVDFVSVNTSAMIIITGLFFKFRYLTPFPCDHLWPYHKFENSSVRRNNILITFLKPCKIPAKKRTIQFRVNVTAQSTNEFNMVSDGLSVRIWGFTTMEWD